jgi:MinD-like ATPase involved in chromosome partitioning or flagellar assembly
MAGKVVTFYSYKGGVGRTFALANVGVILAQWGYRILVIDWDIEAPGLSHYFSEHSPPPTTGVLNFLLDCQADKPLAWNSYTSHIEIPGCRHGLHIMAAAAANEDYTGLVQSLDWDNLYSKHGFGAQIEKLRSDWVARFDFVLIDSRTGVTDFSGLTTVQLPDILAFLFTANVQSLEGSCNIVKRAMQARRNLPVDRPALVPLPIVAKFEQREEYERAQVWRTRFLDYLNPFFDVWAPKEIDRTILVDGLTIPYVPRWTFGEDLAALIEPQSTSGVRTTSAPVSYILETIAAILTNEFNKIQLLCSSRDEYVLTARTAAETAARILTASADSSERIFISHMQKDADLVRIIASFLISHGYEIISDSKRSAAMSFSAQFEELIERADAMIVIVGPVGLTSEFQAREVEWFLRQSLRSDVRRPLIPLLLPGAGNALKDSRLADFAGVHIDPERPLNRQLDHILQRLTTGLVPATMDVVPSASYIEESRVYLYYNPTEDHDWALAVANALESHPVTVMLPAFEGPDADVRQFNIESLKTCDAVILLWGRASEVWVRAQASGLRNWSDLGRTKPFAYRAILVGPPRTKLKLAIKVLFPRSEVDIVIDLSSTKKLEPELLMPLIDLLPS